MLEMFKDKKMQKCMTISACLMSFLVLEIFCLSDSCPWKWLHITAWVIFIVFVMVFFTILVGFMLYADLFGDN